MKQTISAVMLIFAGLYLTGCGGNSKKEEPKVAVKGIVNVDGKPMPVGEIVFSIPGQPGKVFEISNGAYAGEAFEGKNKVEVLLMKDDPKATTSPAPKVNVIPQKYNTASKLEAEVKAGGSNEFKFDITSK